MHARWSCWRLQICIQPSVFCLSAWQRKHSWHLLHRRGVTRRERLAICSRDLRVRGGSALPQICSHSHHPLPGCEHIVAGGLGGQGGEALPSFRCRMQLVAAARSHTPSSAINQVAGISLISYRGEQAEEAGEHCWPRKSGHGTASRGRGGFGAKAPLLIQRQFHFYSSSFRLPSAHGSEVCSGNWWFFSLWNRHLRTPCFAEPG